MLTIKVQEDSTLVLYDNMAMIYGAKHLDRFSIKARTPSSTEIILGVYETEERVRGLLNILEEEHSACARIDYYTDNTGNIIPYSRVENRTYIMPEE